MKNLNIFILAAGLGERLRPITEHIPKPLLPVLGRPILETILEKASSLPLHAIGVNVHHKRQMIQDWIGTTRYAEKVCCFIEEELLGTGGALKNAEALLRESVFLVHNSDIFSDIDLKGIIEEHLRTDSIATLAIHDYSPFNVLGINDRGQLVSDERGTIHRMAFTGIAAYSPEFLDFLPSGNSSVVSAWYGAVTSGKKVGTVDVTGCRWADIGTPDSYASALFQLLKGQGEVLFAHPSVDCSRAVIGATTIIEADVVLKGAPSIKNAILLPGAEIEGSETIENMIVGKSFSVMLSDEPAPQEFPSFPDRLLKYFHKNRDELRVELAGTGGSDRHYYRVWDKDVSLILLNTTGKDPDFERQMTFSRFFQQYGMPVPALIDSFDNHDNDNRFKETPAGFGYALFEDLGDRSLYSWLKCVRSLEEIEDMFTRVLDSIILLHTEVTKHAHACPLLVQRALDYEHLRWESQYFLEHFSSAHQAIPSKEKDLLDDEFHRLAAKVASFSTCIIHRDFQTQNIMIDGEGRPRLIDYQGARLGPSAYDIASILWDPYFRLDRATRSRLLVYYKKRMKECAGRDFDGSSFDDALIPCRLQRHMQALGAYGFLSRVKGKKYFEKHIPQALAYLAGETELMADEYPGLSTLVRNLNEKFAR